ncbi:MAG: alpha/beta hydrolase [Crocinitomix sp.]|nr:alpha/beta hydrolase [Crocinitomix sp.]
MKNILTSLVLTLFTITCFAGNPTLTDTIPKHDSLTIYSEHTKEKRVINVWTPSNYEQTTDSLPVIYMPDGGIKEDFPHIANTLAKLIKNEEIPPCILVGIENTERGRDLTGASTVKKHEKYKIPMSDGAKNFRAFITDELMPEINSRYRTTDKKGIIGESLAGLFVIESLLLKPASFDFYIAMDPSLWWNKNYLVKNAVDFLDNLPKRGTKLWFAGSSVKDISKYTNQLSKILGKENYKDLTWKYSDEPEEKHNTIFRATKEKALIWILNENE